MEIKIENSNELNKLLNNLQREIVDANIYYRMFVDIKNSIDDQRTVFDQSNTLRYLVYDNALGNNEGTAMVNPLGLQLISKLRCDAALWFPDEGMYQGRGAPRKYGEKVDYANRSEPYLTESQVTDGVLTHIDQMSIWHKRFASLLNVVVIRKTNLKTQKVAQIILFS